MAPTILACDPAVGSIQEVELRGVCPHEKCQSGTTFTLLTRPVDRLIFFMMNRGVSEIILSYICNLCNGVVPVRWALLEDTSRPRNKPSYLVYLPRHVYRQRIPFDFDFVPELVAAEISEALDCLSVNAFHGFAAVCRRAVQAICTDLGVNGSNKVEKQLTEALEILEESQSWDARETEEFGDLTRQIMLTGHDGAHPHLPTVTADRAYVIVSLLDYLVEAIYKRPGKIRAAAQLRTDAISEAQKKKNSGV